MTGCLTERELVELATGDGTVAMQAHVATCDACAAQRSALERDLSALRGVLQRAPERVAVRRRVWLPLAAGAFASAALLLTIVTPFGVAPPPLGAADTAASSELDEALTGALFADASFLSDEDSGDDRSLAAALNGGALCDGGYGDDCSTELLLAGYE